MPCWERLSRPGDLYTPPCLVVYFSNSDALSTRHELDVALEHRLRIAGGECAKLSVGYQSQESSVASRQTSRSRRNVATADDRRWAEEVCRRLGLGDLIDRMPRDFFSRSLVASRQSLVVEGDARRCQSN